MKMILLALMISPTFALAADCKFDIDKSQTKINWTAFKTPKKVGVTGEFKKFDLTTKAAAKVEDVISGATFKIDTSSSSTENPARDKTIVTNFFTQNKSPIAISGKVLKVTKTDTVMELDINGKKKEVTLKNEITDKKIKLTGTIDVLDVGLQGSYDALHKACKALHEGKTWTDVNIAIESPVVSTCK